MTSAIQLLDAGAGALMIALGVMLMRARRRADGVHRRLAALVSRTAEAEPDDGAGQPQADGWLAVLCLRADLKPRTVLLLGPGLIGAAGLMAAASFDVSGGVVAAAATTMLAVLAIKIRMDRRRRALRKELPAFLGVVRQHLLVGASITQALHRAIGSGTPTIVAVFAPVERRLRHGAPLIETLDWAARRNRATELASVAAAMAAALTYGGALSDTLNNLAEQVRAQLRMAEELHAASAEVRLSAVILAALPLLVACWLYFSAPGYLDYFAEPGSGPKALAIMAALYLLGCVLLHRIAQPSY